MTDKSFSKFFKGIAYVAADGLPMNVHERCDEDEEGNLPCCCDISLEFARISQGIFYSGIPSASWKCLSFYLLDQS